MTVYPVELSTTAAVLGTAAVGYGLFGLGSLPDGLLVGSFVLGAALFAIQPLSQAAIAEYSLPESGGLSFGYTYLAVFGSELSARRSPGPHLRLACGAVPRARWPLAARPLTGLTLLRRRTERT